MELRWILILFSFAVMHWANGAKDSLAQCLQENGLKMVDLDFMRKAKPSSDMPRNKIIEDKLACAFACSFNRDKVWKDESIFTFMMNVLKLDYRLPGSLKKQMVDKLKSCNDEVGDDDCKLLQCIKVTRYPFVDFVFLDNSDGKHHEEKNQNK